MSEEKLIRKLKAGEITLNKIAIKHRTYKVCLMGCRETLQHVPDKHKTWELCQRAVCLNSSNVQYIPNKFKTKEFYLDVIAELIPQYISYICMYIPKEIKTYDFYLEIAKRNIMYICDFPREYRTHELYYELAKNNKDILKTKCVSNYIPKEYLFRYNPIIIYLSFSKSTPFTFQCRVKILTYYLYVTCSCCKKGNFMDEYTRIFLFIKN